MIKFELDNTIFSARGVGIVINDNKLHVQKRKDDKYWHFPVAELKWVKKAN